MTKIAFLLMAHKDPDAVIAQARALTAHGDTVTIHFDRRAGAAPMQAIRKALKGNPNIAYARRLRCGWGTWSLVQASLNMIRAAKRRFSGITHYYLMSGDCYPTKSRSFIGRFLDEHPHTDFIEVNDFWEGGWIRTGPAKERLIYRHWFNERERKWWFYTSMDLQRRFGWERKPPDGLSMRIGSQWWLLRAATVDALLAHLRQNKRIRRFFRTTWIPDEIFFQTLVGTLIPAGEIRSAPPTHLIFSDYGMPVVFYPDHQAYLRGQPRLFARKLSPDAHGMRSDLLAAFAEDRVTEEEGTAPGFDRASVLYDYLTGRGREGTRYAPRVWQKAIAPPGGGELLIVAAKLWHVGKAVEGSLARIAGLTRLGYVFDEDEDLPLALGNLERGLSKRGRHRRALVNLMIEALDGQRAVFCIDPSRLDVVRDLTTGSGEVRILAVDRQVPQAHLEAHARRAGLLGPTPGAFEEAEVQSALRRDFDSEIKALEQAQRGRVFLNDLTRRREDNLIAIGHFLRTDRATAEAVVRDVERCTG